MKLLNASQTAQREGITARFRAGNAQLPIVIIVIVFTLTLAVFNTLSCSW